ncbi:uS8 family ribosomal protein [endosymbiont GvMRE of Glomus versiforme]|uniref:uS8 family ribosomal protein n=1 Tax=endosymbiont GvMRE of Glomus versiforme TaxID=2039283 RepID=UPI0011C3F1CA|nr:30S ribosomal protein S8 [endosymbiont GvMRE of Glomus versiforme]
MVDKIMLTDPIADMFTCLRNANLRQKRAVSFPYSRFKLDICKKLEENNYLTEHWVDENKRIIKVKIKYFNKDSLLHEVKRISKPSQQIYLSLSQVKKKCLGRRTYLISTSQGLLTHHEALVKKIGGELIGFIS